MNKNKLLSPYNVILLYILNVCFDDCFILIILECSEICRCYRGFLCCGCFSGLGLLNMWKRQRNASLDPNLISRACGERSGLLAGSLRTVLLPSCPLSHIVDCSETGNLKSWGRTVKKEVVCV